MKRFWRILLALVVFLVLVIAIVGPEKIAITLFQPHQSFAETTPAPDYSQIENWAALPMTEDLSDFRPKGISIDSALADVDVFFVHPTGFLKGSHWNSPMDPKSSTEENTKWMMANQASVFSDAMVYAPRYREATIFSFFNRDKEDESAALQLAYEDVARAFDYYIENYNRGRPFILASHSQGSHHSLPLMINKIDKTPLAEQMVAAYVLGISSMSDAAIEQLTNISVCDSPDQTQCLIHWATFAEDAPMDDEWKNLVCVNPLSWKRNDSRVAKTMHKGMVPTTGIFSAKFFGSDAATNVAFHELLSPQPAHTFCECKEGRLLIEKQEDFAHEMGPGNYHGLDFQMFHMDIRENLGVRVRAYNARQLVSRINQ